MRTLTTSILISIAIAGWIAPAGAGCDEAASWTGCEVGNDGTQVDIGGSGTRPGGETGGGEFEAGAPEVNPIDTWRTDEFGNAIPPGCLTFLCRGNYGVEVIPDVTLADLASFRPAAPGFSIEPGGLGVAGLPTNLVATASTHSIPGTLFDRPVTVHFSPARFTFAHGDGTSATASNGGATWAALGQAQFTPTSTSHVYATPGTYAVTITVGYSAVADFGTFERPVTGLVTAGTGPQNVRILDARTALVDQTCVENTSGPGC